MVEDLALEPRAAAAVLALRRAARTTDEVSTAIGDEDAVQTHHLLVSLRQRGVVRAQVGAAGARWVLDDGGLLWVRLHDRQQAQHPTASGRRPRVARERVRRATGRAMPDDWLLGFATALVEVLRYPDHADHKVERRVAREAGLGLAAARRVGLPDADVAVLRRAGIPE